MYQPTGSTPGAAPYVRQRVHDLLAQSEAYQRLPEDRRLEVAADTEKVAQFIVGGSTGTSIPGGATLVGSPAAGRALADGPVDPAGQTAGGRFRRRGWRERRPDRVSGLHGDDP